MRRLLVIFLAVAVAAACATSPTGRRQLQLFPESQMNEMGAAAFLQIQEQVPVDKSPVVNSYVQCVADALLATLPEQRDWEVRVFNDGTANAFALPGGKIGVHTGLLAVAETPGQLAAVIGHEIGHVLAQHSNERVSTAFATNTGLQLLQILAGSGTQQQQTMLALLGLGAQVGIILPFSRTQEAEADVIGLQLMAKAGFDPREAIALWENMERAAQGQPPEFLSTHPSHGSRIGNLQKEMPGAMKLYEQARAAGRAPRCPPPG